MMIEYSTVRGWVGYERMLNSLDPELNVALSPPPPPPSVPTIINDLIHPQYHEAWSRLLKEMEREIKAERRISPVRDLENDLEGQRRAFIKNAASSPARPFSPPCTDPRSRSTLSSKRPRLWPSSPGYIRVLVTDITIRLAQRTTMRIMNGNMPVITERWCPPLKDHH